MYHKTTFHTCYNIYFVLLLDTFQLIFASRKFDTKNFSPLASSNGGGGGRTVKMFLAVPKVNLMR